MPLAAGTTLGVYEVGTLIGRGGMGDVYRARDSKLRREVAIKVLPDLLAGDADRLARFQQEAHVLASLNHPNIAAIYGFEEAAGIRALVLELVEGPTLADRIGQGPIPIDEAVAIAKQIADALESAHEHGIIHRDLKPANIKLRPDGTVKVLDFGLAKFSQPSDASLPPSTLQASPTMTAEAGTHAGMILGTAAYMPPEQAKGKAVDKRADVWAFGCVLYEMLSGRPLYSGETMSEILAAVILTPPDWRNLPASTPVSIRELLARCLEKETRQRLRDIGEARIALERRAERQEAAPTSNVTSRGRWIPWGIAVAAIGLAAFLGLWRREATDGPATRFSIAAPSGATFILPGPSLALSPNGRTLAFVAIDSRGSQLLWYRNLDSFSASPLPGTNGPLFPFWSPDSQFIGYFTNDKLMTVEVATGRVQAICDTGFGTGGTWRDDGVILFAGNTGGQQGLYRVPSAGTVEPVLNRDNAPTQSDWQSPTFLPGGRSFLYIAHEQGQSAWRAYVADIDAPQSRPRYVLDVESKVEYAEPGWLFFVANGRFLAQGFDAVTGHLSGSAISLAGSLQGSSRNGRKAFTVSTAGTLAFREEPSSARLVLRDRTGKQTGTIGQPDDQNPVGFSHDGRKVVFRRLNDVWIANSSGAAETRLTFDAGDDRTPVWSPDAAWLAFWRGDSVWKVRADGTGREQQLGQAGGALTQWLSDGLAILLDAPLRLAPLHGDWAPQRISAIPAGAAEGQVSPDLKWLTYSLWDRGSAEIYVQPFGRDGGRWQISQNGGRQARWGLGGEQIYYLAADGNLMVAEIRTANGVEVVSRVPLFEVGATIGLPNNVGFYYDVSPDGQQFVFSTRSADQTQTPISVILT